MLSHDISSLQLYKARQGAVLAQVACGDWQLGVIRNPEAAREGRHDSHGGFLSQQILQQGLDTTSYSRKGLSVVF